jgi:hypothetical protein
VDQAHPLTPRSLGLGAVVVLLGLACEAAEPPPPASSDASTLIDAGVPDAGRDTSGLPYVRAVVSYTPGIGAGFGQDQLPDIVLGPPDGKGTHAGSLHVLSLGVGGEIVLDTGPITDGPGADLVVFENAFWANDGPANVYAELGEVAVSTDAVSWRTFACDSTRDGRTAWPGCAGWSPARQYDPFVVPLDPAVSGGDTFDLEDVGLSEARYVRIRDRATEGMAPTAGFDLDAVGVVHP